MLKEIVIANKNYSILDAESGKGRLDEIAVNVIRQDCPPFLLALYQMQIDDSIELRYEMEGGIRLAYMPRHMRKKEFKELLTNMIAPFRDCADWLLDYHGIYLDANYIMVDKHNSSTVRYVYFPYASMYNSDEKILQFFRDFIMEVDISDDPAYTTKLWRSIKGSGSALTNLNNILWMDDGMSEASYVPSSEKSQVPTDRQPASPAAVSQPAPSAVPAPSRQDAAPIQAPAAAVSQPAVSSAVKKAPEQNNIMSALGGELFGDDKKKKEKEKKPKTDKKSGTFLGGILNNNKKKEKEAPAIQGMGIGTGAAPAGDPAAAPQPAMYQMPDHQSSQSDNDVTVLVYDDYMGYGNAAMENKVVLILEGKPVGPVPERIELDLSKGYATVGRFNKSGEACADFNFDLSLTYIGRTHLRFEKSGNQIFVIDLDSKNHTWLNGVELVPNHRYEVNRGDIISITQKYQLSYRIG